MPSYASSRSNLLPPIGRRQFLAGAGAASLSLARTFPAAAETASQVDYTIRIAPCRSNWLPTR
jgi:hypothetical protein